MNRSGQNKMPSLEDIRAAVAKTAARKPDISRVVLFGSYARGDARPDSDIDLCVEYGERAAVPFRPLRVLPGRAGCRRETPRHRLSARLGDDAFTQTIDREGVTLYERSQFR